MQQRIGVRADVILDPAAQQALAVGEDDIVEVWLVLPGQPDTAHGPHTRTASGDQLLVVFRGDERVGVLRPEASDAYGPAVAEARDAGLTPVILATRSRAPDGSFRLSLGVPLPGPATARDDAD